MFFKMLDISTIHITPDTAYRLKMDDETLGLVIYPTPYGAFVCVPSDDLEVIEALPEDLRQVVDHAMDFNCDWIKFDCDGDVNPGLKKYLEEWEGV